MIDELLQRGISSQQLSSLYPPSKQKVSAKIVHITLAQESMASHYPLRWIVPNNRKKWLWNQAKTFYAAKLWRESIRLFDEYLELIPIEWGAHLYRGGAQARLGQWKEAKESYRQVVSSGREKARARDWHSLAVLQLREGDRMKYQETCRDVFQLFFQHNNHTDVGNVLQTCILAPDCGQDYVLLLERAKELSEEVIGKEWKSLLIGALQYRSGKFQESHKTLKALYEEHSDHSMPSVRLFLAMACHQLDQTSEKQMILRQTDAWMANLPKPPVYWGEWEEWVLLRKEAGTL